MADLTTQDTKLDPLETVEKGLDNFVRAAANGATFHRADEIAGFLDKMTGIGPAKDTEGELALSRKAGQESPIATTFGSFTGSAMAMFSVANALAEKGVIAAMAAGGDVVLPMFAGMAYATPSSVTSLVKAFSDEPKEKEQTMGAIGPQNTLVGPFHTLASGGAAGVVERAEISAQPTAAKTAPTSQPMKLGM